jgi:pyruvate dehydrogenase (quinone)
MVHALGGKEHVEWDNPYDVGMTGLIGFSSGYKAMFDCDTLLMLGTDFPYRQFYPAHVKIAQVDLLPENLGRRTRLDLGMIGDVGATIEALLPRLKPRQDTAHLDDSRANYRHARHGLDELAAGTSGRKPIHPQHLTRLLSERATDDAVFTFDVGTCTVWAARYLAMNGRRRMIGSLAHGSMANAMPQAIGAQMAFPKRQVISMSGDGGFTMLMGDLLTLAQYELPIKLIIYNNSTLGMVKLEMRVAGYEDYGVDVKNTNFAKMAEAVGIRGIRVESSGDLKSSLQAAFRQKGPVLVDVVTDPNALAMPPKIEAKEVAGYGLYLAKQTLHGRLFESIDELKGNLP